MDQEQLLRNRRQTGGENESNHAEGFKEEEEEEEDGRGEGKTKERFLSSWNHILRLPEEGRAALIASFIGIWIGFGFGLACLSERFARWGVYMSLLGIFHCAEYIITARNNPNLLSTDSFLINHSRAYTFSTLFCWIEHWSRHFYFELTTLSSDANDSVYYLFLLQIISGLGLVCAISGQILRSHAMLECGRGFTHLVAWGDRKKHHHMVTSGAYAYLRHPSYTGSFLQGVGFQLLLRNPFSCLAYVLALWQFFAERIPEEEQQLVRFFGRDYVLYREKVHSGIPFVP